MRATLTQRQRRNAASHVRAGAAATMRPPCHVIAAISVHMSTPHIRRDSHCRWHANHAIFTQEVAEDRRRRVRERLAAGGSVILFRLLMPFMSSER